MRKRLETPKQKYVHEAGLTLLAMTSPHTALAVVMGVMVQTLDEAKCRQIVDRCVALAEKKS